MGISYYYQGLLSLFPPFPHPFSGYYGHGQKGYDMGTWSSLINKDHQTAGDLTARISVISVPGGPHPGPHRFSLCQSLILWTVCDPHEDPMSRSSVLPLDI